MATEPDKVDSGVLGTLIAVLTFGVLATALAVTALVRTEEEVQAAERSGTNEALAELRGAQEADLNLPPAYMDQAKGVVRLPIDRAMQVVVRDLRRNPESATPEKPTENGASAEPGVPDAAGEAGEKTTGAGPAPRDGAERQPPAGEKAPGTTPAPRQPGPTTPKTPPAPQPEAPAPIPKAPSVPPGRLAPGP